MGQRLTTCWNCRHDKPFGPYCSKCRRKMKLGRRPAESTDAYPGSEAKILVMIERLAVGETLDHPDDVRIGRV